MRDKFRSRFNHPKIDHHKVGRDPAMTTKTYYWISAEGGGKNIIWGPYGSRDEASRKLCSKLGGAGEILELHTRDQTRASQLIRSKLLDSSGDIAGSFKRFRHTGSED